MELWIHSETSLTSTEHPPQDEKLATPENPTLTEWRGWAPSWWTASPEHVLRTYEPQHFQLEDDLSGEEQRLRAALSVPEKHNNTHAINSVMLSLSKRQLEEKGLLILKSVLSAVKWKMMWLKNLNFYPTRWFSSYSCFQSSFSEHKQYE